MTTTTERGNEHIATVRWHERLFLWNSHFYYVEDAPVFDDAEFDGVVRCLTLNRELWSPVFRDRMNFLGGDDLKTVAFQIRLTDLEIADAHQWAAYIRFLRKFSGADDD